MNKRLDRRCCLKGFHVHMHALQRARVLGCPQQIWTDWCPARCKAPGVAGNDPLRGIVFRLAFGFIPLTLRFVSWVWRLA